MTSLKKLKLWGFPYPKFDKAWEVGEKQPDIFQTLGHQNRYQGRVTFWNFWTKKRKKYKGGLKI